MAETVGARGATAARVSHPGVAPRRVGSPARAPALPPILAPPGETSSQSQPSVEEPSPQVEPDPLVATVLEVRRVARRNVPSSPGRRSATADLSGFVAAPAPTGDYGLDVHIDTGLSGLGTGTLLGAVQDAFVLPVWMALVWAVHALIVVIEWGFSLEIVGGAAEAEVVRSIAGEEGRVTWPWLPFALAIAGMLVAYRGLLRRRVSQTLGETLVMGAMMAGGLWLISDPGGTVGTLESWSGETSSGALAAASGTPAASARALGDSLDSVFAEAIEGPWCYLEFGDVGWCVDPARLDQRLRTAAVRAASEEALQADCGDPEAPCSRRDTRTLHALRASVTMLRGARTNASVFLALPANGVARNSINRPNSLLRALCQSSDANRCRGPTAAQALFRTASGTESRLSGLALIAAGLLGMMLLLGYVAVRLVTAASQTFVYLLMAPALVLSPAFGERGRALFGVWAVRLLGAVVSKLVFAFMLGLLLSVSAIIARVPGPGWWAQWLLLACFWWTTFVHRRRLLTLPFPAMRRAHTGGLARGLAYGAGRSATNLALRRLVARRDEAKASARARALIQTASESDSAEDEQRPSPSFQGPIDDDVKRLLAGDERTAVSAARHDPDRSQPVLALRDQLGRIEQARMRALTGGDRRRAIELNARRERVQAELEEHRLASWRDAGTVQRGRSARPLRGASPTRFAVEERDRFLDFQAALPDTRQWPGVPFERDYATLAPLAGHDDGSYEQLGPGAKRRVRLDVDRRLRGRRARVMEAWPGEARTSQTGAAGKARPRSPIFERRWGWKRGEHPPLDERASRDPVMRDLWAVAAGEKRELGIGRD